MTCQNVRITAAWIPPLTAIASRRNFCRYHHYRFRNCVSCLLYGNCRLRVPNAAGHNAKRPDNTSLMRQEPEQCGNGAILS